MLAWSFLPIICGNIVNIVLWPDIIIIKVFYGQISLKKLVCRSIPLKSWDQQSGWFAFSKASARLVRGEITSAKLLVTEQQRGENDGINDTLRWKKTNRLNDKLFIPRREHNVNRSALDWKDCIRLQCHPYSYWLVSWKECLLNCYI